MALGATGVLGWHAFLAATEADIHADYQAGVIASSGDDTLYSPNCLIRLARRAAPDAEKYNHAALGRSGKTAFTESGPARARRRHGVSTDPGFRGIFLDHEHAI